MPVFSNLGKFTSLSGECDFRPDEQLGKRVFLPGLENMESVVTPSDSGKFQKKKGITV
jgi:hypothetical protein